MALTTLADARRMMAVGTFPGTRRVIGEGDDVNLITGEIEAEFTLLPHGVPETRSIDFEPCSFHGIDAEHVLAANIMSAALLHFDGERFSAIKTWGVRSKTTHPMHISVAADAGGEVMICAARNYLCRLRIDDKSRYAHTKTCDIWQVAVPADGSVVVNGREDGRIELRDPDTLQVTKKYTFQEVSTCLLALAINADATKIAFSDDAWQAFVLDLDNGELQKLPTVGKVSGLHWLPDGRVVIVNLSRTVTIVDGEETVWERSFDPELGDRYVQDSAILGDGSGIVLACEEKGLVWAPFDDAQSE